MRTIKILALVALMALASTPAKAGMSWSLTGANPEWGPVGGGPVPPTASSTATGGMWNWLFRGFTFAE
jgi:hypothetical protein